MSCGCSSTSDSVGACSCSCCTTKKYALTIVRMVLGVIFFMHGAQKVLGWFGGHGFAGTVQGMTGMGLPLAVVYIDVFTEFLGGIALFFGALSRLAAFGIMCMMIGAIVIVHWKNGFFLNWMLVPGVGHGYEYHLALIAMSLSIIVGGAGGCALDNCLCKSKSSCCS